MAEREKRLTKKQKNAVKKALRNKKIFWTVVAIILIVAIAFAVFYFAFPDEWNKFIDSIFGPAKPDITNPDGHLAVHFLDVGQGDCIIIQLPDGKNMIIDAGGDKANNNGGESAEKIILDRIDALGIKVFDYMMLTHSDGDPVDYMDSVLRATTVHNIYRPAFLSKSEAAAEPDSKYGHIETVTYDNFVKAVDEEIETEGAKEYLNIKGLEPIRGEGYQIDIYAPAEDAYLKSTVGDGERIDAKERNAVSPFTVLSYGNSPTRTIVFTGDAEGRVDGEGNGAEQVYLDEYRPRYNADVLKVGHHGSRSSASNEFLKAIDPEFAVISVGTEKQHGHPTDECLGRLNEYRDGKDSGDSAGIKSYLTAWQGDITLRISPDCKMVWETDFPDTNTAPPTSNASAAVYPVWVRDDGYYQVA